MDKEAALALLKSEHQHDRLKAARYFQLSAEPADAAALRDALRREDVVWVRAALEDALAVAEMDGDSGGRPPAAALVEQAVPPEAYRAALREAAGALVHEIRHAIGSLRVTARKDVPEYETSRTRERIDRVAHIVDAIDLLRNAAERPRAEEFDLSEWLRATAEDEMRPLDVPVELVGTAPFMVMGDQRLLSMAVSNVIRNAAEATLSMHQPGNLPPVTVTWGETDTAYWIGVADRGPGPPKGSVRAFSHGVTNKDDHLGWGLPIARTAMDSLSGSIELGPRASIGGAIVDLRWPKPMVAQG